MLPSDILSSRTEWILSEGELERHLLWRGGGVQSLGINITSHALNFLYRRMGIGIKFEAKLNISASKKSTQETRADWSKKASPEMPRKRFQLACINFKNRYIEVSSRESRDALENWCNSLKSRSESAKRWLSSVSKPVPNLSWKIEPFPPSSVSKAFRKFFCPKKTSCVWRNFLNYIELTTYSYSKFVVRIWLRRSGFEMTFLNFNAGSEFVSKNWTVSTRSCFDSCRKNFSRKKDMIGMEMFS